MGESTIIRILYSEGCTNYGRAVDAAERAAADFGGGIEIRTVNIDDEATAVAEGFRGSPTVTVNGMDVDPAPSIEPGLAG